MDFPQGFQEYVYGQRTQLMRTAILLTGGDVHRAEDLVQDTLVKVWPRWNRIRAGDSVNAYVRKTMVSLFLTAQRRFWRRELPVTSPPELPATAPDVEEALAAQALLRRLPPRQRAVVTLRYFLDLSEVETAEVLGCAVGTVKTHNFRALSALRTMVERERDRDTA